MAPSGHMRAVMSQQVMLSITTTCTSWCGLSHNITLHSVCGVDIALPRLSSIPLNSFSARHSNCTLVYSLFYSSCLLLLSFLSAAISFLNNTYRFNPLTFNVFTVFQVPLHLLPTPYPPNLIQLEPWAMKSAEQIPTLGARSQVSIWLCKPWLTTKVISSFLVINLVSM